MKTRLVLFSIFVLCFGSSFCMAKSGILATPMLSVRTTDDVECAIVNSGVSTIDVTIQLLDSSGANVHTRLVTLGPKEGETTGFSGISSLCFCTFTFHGTGKPLHGMIQVSDLSTQVIHAALPAN